MAESRKRRMVDIIQLARGNMSRNTLRFVATVVVSPVLCVQAFGQSQTRDDLLRDLKRTTQELAAVRSTGDGNAWARYATAEFVVIHPDGRLHNRSQETTELNASGGSKPLVREEEEFHWYGDNTVVISLKFVARSGQPVRAIETWVRESGSWKIAAAQVTRIE